MRSDTVCEFLGHSSFAPRAELNKHYYGTSIGLGERGRRDYFLIPPSPFSAIEMTLHGPMGEMMGGPGDDESMMMLHHLVRSMDRYIRIPKRTAKGEANSPEKGE
jgi:hypothetical protein